MKKLYSILFICTVIINLPIHADEKPPTNLHQALLDTIQMLSTDQCPNPKEGLTQPNLQCFELEFLEQNLGQNLSQAHNGLAIPEEELEKYGKKHLNLVKMAHVVETLQLPGVEVPLPRGISSDEIITFLRTHAPTVFDHWKQLGRAYEGYNGLEPFLKTADAKNHLLAIETSIRNAFALAAADENMFKLSNSLKGWLQQVQADGQYLMVRSTGDEDNKELANAGGNFSAAYVPPTRSDLLKAVGDVVKSYFEFGSLQNRLNVNQNPFNKEIKAPVTIQQLIGETIDGSQNFAEIPISLVLFTNEPLYVGEEKFRVMRLSTTYGHGQGVVGNYGLATDTVLMLRSESQPDQLYVLYDNRAKPARLAPVFTAGGVILDKMNNPQELATRPALNESLLNRLYHLGVVMESYFGQSTDMEIVIKGDRIYPVQARPVNRLPLLPTYLDRAKMATLPVSPILQQLKAEVIVPGKASVVQIDKRHQILYADTLENAERAFIRDKHRLVVVGKSEPANSHPVVNFSGLGIPCLYVNQEGAFQSLVGQISRLNPLVVCMQTALLSLWDARTANPQELISQGFVVHPAPLSLSTSQELISATANAQIPPQIRTLLENIRQATTREQLLAQTQHLRQLTLEPIQQAIAEVRGQLTSMQWTPMEIQQSLNALQGIHQSLDHAFTEFEALQNYTSNDRLRPLLRAKVIEEIIGGHSKAVDGLGQYSWRDVSSLKQIALELVDYQNALPHQARLTDLLQVGHEAPNPEIFPKWQASLLTLEQAAIQQEDLERLRTFILTLQRTGALPTWLMLFFQTQTGTPQEMLDSWFQTLPETDHVFITMLEEQALMIQQFHNRLEDFAQPDRFDAAWADLQLLMQTWSGSRGERKVWQYMNRNRGFVTQSIALKTMDQLVDLFDKAIKKMKGNQALSATAKVTRFKQMLTPLFEVFRSWAAEFLEGRIGTSVSDYLTDFENIFRALSDTDPAQLEPSVNFNVAAAVINSGALFERHHPEKLEDVFTLLHQNLLAVIAFLNNDLLDHIDLKSTLLPPSFLEHFDTISQWSFGGRWDLRQFQRIGFDISPQGITARFNYPLRNHSGQAELHYDTASGQSTFKSSFFGIRPERWTRISDWANVLNQPELLPLETEARAKELGVTFTWIIEPHNFRWALDEYGRMADFTLNEWRDIQGLFEEIYTNAIAQRSPELAQKGFMGYSVPHTNRPYEDFFNGQLLQGFHGQPRHVITAILRLAPSSSSAQTLATAWKALCLEILTKPDLDVAAYFNHSYGWLQSAERNLMIGLAQASQQENLCDLIEFTLMHLISLGHLDEAIDLATSLLNQGHRLRPEVVQAAANLLTSGNVLQGWKALKFFRLFSQATHDQVLVQQVIYEALSETGNPYQSIVWILTLLFIS